MLTIKEIGRLWMIAVTCLVLSACADVAVSGAQAVYNHHSIQRNLSDQYITVQAYKKFDKNHALLKDANVSVATFNGEVLLSGQVPEKWQRDKIKDLVLEIPNIEEVHNLITLSNPSSTLTRISDAWITTKIKTKLIASIDLDATAVKVVTENGTVFLMGLVRPSEAEEAVTIASNTDGVNQVVKVFRYLRICKS